MLKSLVLLAGATFTAYAFVGGAAAGGPDGPEARRRVVRLGERLFRDARFSTPDGDLPASCSHCHLLDEDPQGLRAFADFFNRSWVSSRSRDRRRLELRNSPTIFDVADMPRLHYDGEFASLEALVKGTLSGRPTGWLPGEEARAFAHARAVLVKDEGEGGAAPYREQFRGAFGVDPAGLGPAEAADLIATAVAEYCRTLRAPQASAYDQFIKLNGLGESPAAGESGAAFARRLLGGVGSLESRGALKLVEGFDAAALRGLKLFFRADGGNCAACHAPPRFTDDSFHNLGVSQREYDRFHGDGAFAALDVPGAADAERPSPQFREMPSRARPGEADLGFWNFVDLKSSTLRRKGESDERFLRRMIATFKTPTLRNLRYTQPYFHDGSLHTLEEVLSELVRLSGMARAGSLREADEELAKVSLAAADLPPLAAFLESLNDDLKQARASGR